MLSTIASPLRPLHCSAPFAVKLTCDTHNYFVNRKSYIVICSLPLRCALCASFVSFVFKRPQSRTRHCSNCVPCVASSFVSFVARVLPHLCGPSRLSRDGLVVKQPECKMNYFVFSFTPARPSIHWIDVAYLVLRTLYLVASPLRPRLPTRKLVLWRAGFALLCALCG